MSSSFRVPTRENLIGWLIEECRDNIPNANLDDGEPYAVYSSIYGTGQWSTIPPMQFAAQQIIPSTASEEYITRHGRWRRMPRRPPSTASGLMLVDGTAGTALPGGSIVNDEGGHQYRTTAAAIISRATWLPIDVIAADAAYPDRFVVRTAAGMAVGDVIGIGGLRFAIRDLPGGGAIIVYGSIPIASMIGLAVTAELGAVVPIQAESVGDEFNRRPGDTLTIQGAPTGIAPKASALLVSIGQNVETFKAWVERMQLRDTEYPAGGNRSQLALWMLGFASKLERDLGLQMEYALGVARGWVYPLFRGLGTGDLLPQGVAGARHLAPGKLFGMQQRINPEPTDALNTGLVGMGADIKVKDHVDLPVDLHVQIFGAPGYPPDFTSRFVAAPGGTKTRINLTRSPVGIIVPGNRVAFQSAASFVVRRVAMVDGTGITLESEIPAPVAAGELVYPGSSLIEPARDALNKLMDMIGPGDTSPPSRYPPPNSDEPAELRRPNIDRYIMEVSGMRTCNIVSPAADVIPPAQVQLVPRRIVVEHML